MALNTPFQLGEALDVAGRMVPAYGLMHDEQFIVNPYASDCGRFHCAPSEYGLTHLQAVELTALNAGRNLLAYWDL
jgi:hypothetical protein